MDRFQARIDLAQPLRIELDPVEVVVERVHRFLQLDAGRLHAVEHALQAGVDVDQLAQLGVQRRQLRQDRVVRFGDRRQRFLRAFEQAGGVRQAAVLVADVGPFARLDGQLVQFADLPLEPLALDQHVLGVVLELFALAHQRAPLLVGGRDLVRQRRGAGVLEAGLVVEQRALGIGLEQRLVRVLAVDVDQHVAQVAQLARRWRRCR